MSSNNSDSFGKFGMLLFVSSFIGVSLFFIYVMIVNPGGIDTGVFEVPVQFAKAQADERTTNWKDMSAENLAHGGQFYKVNCAFCHTQSGKDVVLDHIAAGNLKFGKTFVAELILVGVYI